MTTDLRVDGRVSELVHIGQKLKRYLEPVDLQVCYKEASEQFYHVSRIAKESKLRAAAVSLLCCNFANQIELNKYELLSLVDWDKECAEVQTVNHKTVILGKDGKFNLPLKSHRGARNKVNVYFSEVMGDLKGENKLMWIQLLEEQWRFGGLFDDQASALVMYAFSLGDEFTDALNIATVLIHNVALAKSLSVVIKALGLNGTDFGSMLTEANTLQGRGVAEVDLHKELYYRLDAAAVREKNVNFPEAELRAAVRTVIRTELKDKSVRFADVDEHWSKRWLWCVNGAHGGALASMRPKYEVEFARRMHRKVFSENLQDEPITDWDATSFFTLSEKLEHGKTRAIFGGDTISYFCFDHFLKPIESAWRDYRVVLDPGKGGSIGMAERVERMKGAWHVMMDYDDFNSQHSLLAQAIVIDEAVKESGYDPVLGKKLVNSFYNQYIVIDGSAQKSEGTLMSGHRATTFINSVLNLAYVLCAAPEALGLYTLHVGDDIYIRSRSAVEASNILSKVSASGVRMNPVKQSIGTSTAEFLRHASGRTGSYGYVARSISSVISGNWVSEAKLGAVEFIASISQSSWTLFNRSRTHVSSLLARALNRVTGIKLTVCRMYLRGELSINNSPVRANSWTCPRFVLKSVAQLDNDISLMVTGLGGKKFATTSYLSKHVTPTEVVALQLVGGDISEIMVRSSYAKTLIDRDLIACERVKLNYQGVAQRPNPATNISEVGHYSLGKTGVLLKHPLICLVKDRLSNSEITHLLAFCEADLTVDYSVREIAFGLENSGLVWVIGAIPYSDVKGLVFQQDTKIYTIRQRYF